MAATAETGVGSNQTQEPGSLSSVKVAGTQILGPSSAAIRDGHVQETASEVGEGIEPRHSEMDASVPLTNLTPELNVTPVLGIVTL